MRYFGHWEGRNGNLNAYQRPRFMMPAGSADAFRDAQYTPASDPFLKLSPVALISIPSARSDYDSYEEEDETWEPPAQLVCIKKSQVL